MIHAVEAAFSFIFAFIMLMPLFICCYAAALLFFACRWRAFCRYFAAILLDITPLFSCSSLFADTPRPCFAAVADAVDFAIDAFFAIAWLAAISLSPCQILLRCHAMPLFRHSCREAPLPLPPSFSLFCYAAAIMICRFCAILPLLMPPVFHYFRFADY